MADETSDAAAPAQEERGEIALILDGAPMVLRPSYEAIAQFELETGRGLLDLSRDALNGRLPTGMVAQIVTACIRAWGRETQSSYAMVNVQRIADLIMEAEGGFHEVLQTVSGMLAMAVTGGYTAKGEVKATTKTKTTDEAPAVA